MARFLHPFALAGSVPLDWLPEQRQLMSETTHYGNAVLEMNSPWHLGKHRDLCGCLYQHNLTHWETSKLSVIIRILLSFSYQGLMNF